MNQKEAIFKLFTLETRRELHTSVEHITISESSRWFAPLTAYDWAYTRLREKIRRKNRQNFVLFFSDCIGTKISSTTTDPYGRINLLYM